MKILIDTHALLWLITGDKQLSAKSSQIFSDTDNELFFSMASFWEICIKVSIGKLQLSDNWDTLIKDELTYNSIKLLPISEPHCLQVIQFPFYHRDPFDRLIIAQAVVEEMQIMTADNIFSQYEVKTIW